GDRIGCVGPRGGQAASCGFAGPHEGGNRSRGGPVAIAIPCSVGVPKMSTRSPWTRTFAGQPAPGARAERSRTTTVRDVEMFTEMTGDRNPIHYDAELAAKSSSGGLIVQGGVTTGLLIAGDPVKLPAP